MGEGSELHEDTGVHGLFGGEAWSELCIVDPDGRQILLTDPQEQLGDLTVADLFFESREPPADEYEVEVLVLVLEESGNQTISVGFIRTG